MSKRSCQRRRNAAIASSSNAAEPAGELRYRVALYLGGETSYRLELEDTQGLGNGGGVEYPIRLLPDVAPTVEVSEPAAEVERSEAKDGRGHESRVPMRPRGRKMSIRTISR